MRAWLARPAVRVAFALLILAWMGLTVTEIAVARPHAPHGEKQGLEALSLAFAGVFALELALRAGASTSWRRFVREHWTDVVAVLAAAPGLAAAWPAVRLLRLLRVVRLVAIVQRLPALPGFARRRTARRAIGLAGFVALASVT